MYQIITDMQQADELWAAGLLYCSVDEDGWFLDDSYLPIYQGPFSMWQPSQSADADAPQYAIYVED